MAEASIDEVTERLAQTKVEAQDKVSFTGKGLNVDNGEAQTQVALQNEISFKGKGLKLDKAEDAKCIIEEILKCSHMTALRMEGNTLGVEAAEAIASALGKHSEFERAYWSDMFTGRLKTEIPPALKHLGTAIISANCHLTVLDLSDNAFGPRGVEGLVDLLQSSSCFSLRELLLNNNGLGIGGGKMLSECLLECHRKSVAAGQPLALRVFVSGRNRLENDGAKALAAAFKTIGTLEELCMPQNGINPPGISALVDAISVNTNLRVLNLNDNTFTATGAKEMAKVLPKLQNLEVVNFGDCLVRTEGAKALAVALKDSHSKLKELILSGNEIKQPGALSVAECVSNKDNLKLVDLNANQLGDEGVELVRDSMEAVGKLNALASFSDDEGCSEDEEGDEPPEEDTEGEVNEDPELQVKGKAITPSKQVSAEDFLSFPSPSKLQQLGFDKVEAMKKAIGTDINDPNRLVETVIKVSLIVSEDDAKTMKAACECADGLLKHAFDNIENAASVIPNAFLVFLGLLKSEDKKYKAPSSITGPLLVLSHIVKQTYFPKSARDTFQFFFSRPHPQLEKSSTARHKILESLYAF
ncbi:hypothetical protein C0Q70_05581 [Pomacea canaliculata]|uniref:Ran-GTPase activating protein 1 C-terminal domain-containing protein n=1 Tax=Pomacea canaliculata TaxID=400727 RepID=A0A2T7PLL9_POMCA|nr:ran GTPase-activating protein 1-like [Pomacea canaliculata]PVD34310.1 hypothetical protein C0Q70_05581 [Pomacea canaliculata]